MRGILYGLPISILLWLLILWLLFGCAGLPHVEFDDAQCRFLRQRGVNTALLCRRPPGSVGGGDKPVSGHRSVQSERAERWRFRCEQWWQWSWLTAAVVVLVVLLRWGRRRRRRTRSRSRTGSRTRSRSRSRSRPRPRPRPCPGGPGQGGAADITQTARPASPAIPDRETSPAATPVTADRRPASRRSD